MKLVIAGNYNEYLRYLRESKETRQTAKFIFLEKHLEDILKDHNEVITYGTWYRNPIVSLIKQQEIT